MPVTILDAETLLRVGPRIEVHVPGAGLQDVPVIQQMLKADLDAIYKDLCDRPGISESRKLSITFEFTPEVNQQNRLFGVQLGAKIKSSVPEQKMPGISLGVDRNKLFFRHDSIDDARQMTLADAQPQAVATTPTAQMGQEIQ